MPLIDIEKESVRGLNQRLQSLSEESNETSWEVINPHGAHAVAVGLLRPILVEVKGHVGYYCGGMNKEATVVVDGHASQGVGENIMSGMVRVKGNASMAAGAAGHGGMVVIEGDTSSRCGISMKGVDIVVGGSVGHMSAFMAQAGNLVICGDAGADLGDSIYEAVIYVGGEVTSLGSDCIEKKMTKEHINKVEELLSRAEIKADVSKFRRFGSARNLYNFAIDNAASY